MCAPSAPEPTDPRETSAAQTGTNVGTAIANSYLNNYNQITPDGMMTWEDTGQTTFKDPYTGKSYDIPLRTVTQTLSPQQQAIKQQSDASELNLATLANNQSAFLNDYMAKPFNYGVGEYEQWANGLYNELNSDNNARAQQQLESQLAQKGIGQGSDQWSKAMNDLNSSQQNSQNQFLLDAYNTGMNTALTERNQPINEITALLSGSQVSQPNFVNTPSNRIANTDNTSIIGNYDKQRSDNWQASQYAMGGLFDSLGSLGSTLITKSDERAKTDKKKIGETEDGLGLYSFKYKGSPKTEIGLMAQDVVKKKPKAVSFMSDGLMGVNYEEALK